MPLSPPAATALARLRAQLDSVAVLSDFDGTLAPIVARPEDARLLPGGAEALAALVQRAALVAVVSGRPLGLLRELVPVEGVSRAGNHGLELERAHDAPRLAAGVEPEVARIVRFGRALDHERLAAEGVSLEDKGVTLTLHFRRAGDPDRASAYLRREVAAEAERAGLEAREGRMVLEIRPRVGVDKGSATRALLEQTGARHAVFFGDDRTDLDAWAALRRLRSDGHLESVLAVAAVVPEVPPEVRAAADVEVDGPPGVLEALRFLLGHPRGDD